MKNVARKKSGHKTIVASAQSVEFTLREQTGHTPGPWKVNPTGDVGQWCVGTAECPIATVETKLPDKIWKANARLIAAAPTLLEAAKAIKPILGNFCAQSTDNRLRELRTAKYQQLEVAIKLAEGK